MFWRLPRSSSVQPYLHVEKPSAFILYDDHSEKLCAALCGRLISQGFDIVVISISQQSSLHDHLQAAYPNKSIVAFTADIENPETSMQSLSDAAQSHNVTLCINAVNGAPLSVGSRSDDESPTSTHPPVELFVDFQKLVLPHLAHNAPSALVFLANSLYPFADHAELLRSFTNSLSNEIHSLGHDKLHVTLMEYLDPTTAGNSILSPSVEVLADSILQALGRSSPHIIPYWSHKLFSWFIWLVWLIFPSSIVRKWAS